jgi:hypothetical protein
MAIVSDSKRKNAFSHRLKDKPKQLSEPEPEMSADQMKVAGKMAEEVSRSVFNLSCVIRDPSEGQAKIIEGWLDDLNEKIQAIRSKL